MSERTPIALQMPDGLPHREYSICDGTVTVVVDQSGGINMIEYQGPRRSDGKRRGAFFSREVWRRNSFFPGPVIWFELTIAGQRVAVDFRNLEVTPFGMWSTFRAGDAEFRYAIWIRGKTVVVDWQCDQDADIALAIREGFTEHCNVLSLWDTPEFRPDWNGVVYNLLVNFAESAKPHVPTRHRYEASSLVWACSPAAHEYDGECRRLRVATSAEQATRFVIGFAEDPVQLGWLRAAAAEGANQWLAEQEQRYLELNAGTPQLTATTHGEADPMLAELIRAAPLFSESTRRVKNAEEVALRASTRGYGLWNGWDGQSGCLLLNSCNSQDTVPRFLNHLEGCRAPNGAVPFVVDYDFGPIHDENFHTPKIDRRLGEGYQTDHEMWGVDNLHQYYFRSKDRALLERLYPGYARSLREIHSHMSDHGLVHSCFGGADYGDQVNRPLFPDKIDNCTLTSPLCGVEDMGILFNGAIQGAELAAELEDAETLAVCVDMLQKIEAHYVDLFFDEESGYLVDCVWPKDAPTERNLFPRITSLMAFYGYGEQLLLGKLQPLCDYVMENFRHPQLGLQNIPVNHPPNPKFTHWHDHWLQNATRQTLKFAKLANCDELLNLQLAAIRQHYATDRLIHEDLYYAYEGGHYKPENVYQSTSWWQNMTTGAWWHGVIEAVAGIRWARGQIDYLPGDSGHDVLLENVHWGGHVWRFKISGRGRWVDAATVNGQPRVASCQLTATPNSEQQDVTIVRSNDAPTHPVLLSAGASPVKTAMAEDTLVLECLSPGFVRLHFFSPQKPVVRVNEQVHPFVWHDAPGEGTMTITESGDLRITIE